jgi:hypothetical protein
MSVSSVGDLAAPVTAAKADWLVATHWIGFTPSSDGPGALPQCQATVAAQAANGYVLEYITQKFGMPNAGHETDPQYLTERAAHAEFAGRLVAVHRLRPTARPLRAVLGDADFEALYVGRGWEAPALVGRVSHCRELQDPNKATRSRCVRAGGNATSVRTPFSNSSTTKRRRASRDL